MAGVTVDQKHGRWESSPWVGASVAEAERHRPSNGVIMGQTALYSPVPRGMRKEGCTEECGGPEAGRLSTQSMSGVHCIHRQGT